MRGGLSPKANTTNKYPVDGANVIKPVYLPSDIRAPFAGYTDMTGKAPAEIHAALDETKVYLGPGVYNMTKTITKGSIFGAGVTKTILKFLMK